MCSAADQPDSNFKGDVLDTVRDRDFWCDLIALLPVLEPFAQAIMEFQGDTTTLADVMLHWLRIAAAIQVNMRRVDRGQSSTFNL